MRDRDCIEFLRWALPQAGLRWRGFRKVRRTVCKRVARRIRELGLADSAAYRSWLAGHPDEWELFKVFCHIPISRFWRDRALFDWLAQEALPACAAEAARKSEPSVRCWSAGCASGEEPYSLRLAWALHAERSWPSIRIRIIATDADETMIQRARAGRYSKGSLRDLPAELATQFFEQVNEEAILLQHWQDDIVFQLQDLRHIWPEGAFDIILCRNTAFTYFDEDGQRKTLDRLADRLRPGGLLIIGNHEQLPQGKQAFESARENLPVYRMAAPRPGMQTKAKRHVNKASPN